MSWIAGLFIGSSLFLLADPDVQPRCRESCDAAYASELAACDDQATAGASGRVVDECRDGAENRHQDCIDQCND